MSLPLPPFVLKRSTRSRRLRLRVSAGGKVVVTAPTRTLDSTITQFIESHAKWLCTKVEYFKKFPEPLVSASQEKKLYLKYKQKAHIIAKQKLYQWNEVYNFPFKKVAIRNSRSRWGSCSSSGTISFNYKIAFLPVPLADYLVVHELCHIKEPNHSKNFWSLVAETIPDYAEKRHALRNFEKTFKPPTVEV